MVKKYSIEKRCEYAIEYSRELNQCSKEGYCNNKVVIPPIGKNKICLCSKLRENADEIYEVRK